MRATARRGSREVKHLWLLLLKNSQCSAALRWTRFESVCSLALKTCIVHHIVTTIKLAGGQRRSAARAL